MTKITSKQNRKTIWFSILFSIIFFGAIGTFMIYLFYIKWTKNELENKTYLMPVFGVLVYFIAYNFVKNYIKRSPKIVVDNEKIIIKRNTYYWKDLQNVKLTGKKGFGFFNYQMEVATLNFTDKKTEFIFDDMYSNSWEIKSFIQQIVIQKKNTFEIRPQNINPKEIEKETFYKFKGNPVFSFRGLMMWGLIGFFAYLIIFTNGKLSKFDQMKFFIPFSLFWFLLNAYSMNYFEISKNFFIVKNHYFFWKKKIYRISDIEEIVYETQQKQSNILRVITTDFKRGLYPAGTLKDSNWIEMKEELEKKKIKVRNECI
jgi:hypothetical protein